MRASPNEVLRESFVDDLTHAEAAERFGCTRWTTVALVRGYRVGKLDLSAPGREPGPAPGATPAKDRARGRAIAYRLQGLSAHADVSITAGADRHRPRHGRDVAQILNGLGGNGLVDVGGRGGDGAATSPGSDVPTASARSRSAYGVSSPRYPDANTPSATVAERDRQTVHH